jgi:hypothetical protein
MLSQRGEQRELVDTLGLPSWTDWFKEFRPRLKEVTLRTIQRKIAEYRGKKPVKRNERQKYDAVDIAHLEQVAKAAEEPAKNDIDNPAYNPIREAIANKPDGRLAALEGHDPKTPVHAQIAQEKLDPRIAELEPRVAELEKENALLKAERDNLVQRLEALSNVPAEIRDDQITSTLAAEPDRGIASKTLTAYLRTVAEKKLPPGMSIRAPFLDGAYTCAGLSAYLEFAGRDERIMIGDYLSLRKDAGESPVLCRCTAIGECEKRRRVREWNGQWGKEHVVYWNEDRKYRVISEAAARELAPEAFGPPPDPPSTSKAKRWFKVGDDSRNLGIGTKNDLRAQGKCRRKPRDSEDDQLSVDTKKCEQEMPRELETEAAANGFDQAKPLWIPNNVVRWLDLIVDVKGRVRACFVAKQVKCSAETIHAIWNAIPDEDEAPPNPEREKEIKALVAKLEDAD